MKNLKSKLFVLIFIMSCFSLTAQYTEVINSNKPGLSESPYSVGSGIYQFESNFFYKNTSHLVNFSIPNSYGFDLIFRTSFLFEKLEVNTHLTYQKDEVNFRNAPANNYTANGLSRFTVGAKYLLYQPEYKDKSQEVRSWKRRMAFDKKRLIPSVAIYAGLNTNLVGDIYKTGTMSPKAGILLQHNLSNQFNIITNIFYDQIGTDFENYSFIITSTYNYNIRWSSFLENQTLFFNNQTNFNFGAGFAYLFSENLQINASGRFINEASLGGYFLGLGLSYRIDKHKDSFKLIDDNGKEIKDTPISRYNKKQNNFFKRLLNIFKKKSKKNTRRKRVKRKRN